MQRILLLALAALFATCNAPADRWLAEDESGAARIVARGDSLEITAPEGLTLWLREPLKGDYRISYAARMLTGSPAERLSDLNCFWAARDPQHPDDIGARSAWRQGVFRRYNSLDLFYVGFGGNENTTTRFRRYRGDRFGAADSEVKPLLGEYTDPAHLLAPGRTRRIVITVQGGRTSYAVDGEELFSRRLFASEGDGWFGLRLLRNHVVISGFKIEYL